MNSISLHKAEFFSRLDCGRLPKKISVKTVTRPRLEDLTTVVKFQYLSRNSEKLDTLNNQFKYRKL